MIEEFLRDCSVCPRKCHINRTKGDLGWCKSGAGFYISSICIHRGEEPVISGNKGICNVFFAHCNLQCVYCQNNQISNNFIPISDFEIAFENVILQITKILDTGINILGFVSPSHFVPQMLEITNELNIRNYKPTIVYNSNGYDDVEMLKKLENSVDVYLPDFKYIDSKISKKYSLAENYPEIAKSAIKEMYRQKGSTVIVNDNGYAESGLIIRHLVLPDNVENSKKIMEFIAEEISVKVHISLMSQYYPTENCQKYNNLNRTLYVEEYQQVVSEMQNLGLYNGYIQELESSSNYKPDFNKKHPFE